MPNLNLRRPERGVNKTVPLDEDEVHLMEVDAGERAED